MHNCLYPKHIFIRENVDCPDKVNNYQSADVCFIDLEKCKYRPLSPLAMFRDLESLARRSAGWTQADRMRFLLAYLGIDRMDSFAKNIWRKLEGRIGNRHGIVSGEEIDSDPRSKSDRMEYRKRIKQSDSSAKQYQHRKPKKHHMEMALVKRAMARLPRQSSVLDIPCGAGRITIMLERLGFNCAGADIGDGVIDAARSAVRLAGLDAPVEKQDLEQMSYADQSFDAIVCFRMFHHFPSPDIRRRAVSELCRVAKNYVLISYFSPYSITSVKRKIREGLGGKRSRQNATPLREVTGYFSEQGFTLENNLAQMPFVHTLHIATFRRIIL
jgi:2-polyprenyl-3-methyl-5-hydroxy-6-metoxy-1,4-benzoquinol methylase